MDLDLVLESSEFQNCCGMAEIGNFGDLKSYLDDLRQDYENEGDRLPSNAALLKTVIDQTVVAIRNETSSGKKAYIATTAAHQKHAIAALQKLRFTALESFPGQEGRITLWFKKIRL